MNKVRQILQITCPIPAIYHRKSLQLSFSTAKFHHYHFQPPQSTVDSSSIDNSLYLILCQPTLPINTVLLLLNYMSQARFNNRFNRCNLLHSQFALIFLADKAAKEWRKNVDFVQKSFHYSNETIFLLPTMKMNESLSP